MKLSVKTNPYLFIFNLKVNDAPAYEQLVTEFTAVLSGIDGYFLPSLEYLEFRTRGESNTHFTVSAQRDFEDSFMFHYTKVDDLKPKIKAVLSEFMVVYNRKKVISGICTN
jgi:hypothetical protein